VVLLHGKHCTMGLGRAGTEVVTVGRAFSSALASKSINQIFW